MPRTTTLADLHHVLQAAFGWLDHHLHEFRIGGLRFGDTAILNEAAFEDDAKTLPAETVRLLDFAHDSPPFVHVHDFGDDWRHHVEIEGLHVIERGRKYPACVEGARSRPPEDVGGVHGYETFLEILANPGHHEHKDTDRQDVAVFVEVGPQGVHQLGALMDELLPRPE